LLDREGARNSSRSILSCSFNANACVERIARRKFSGESVSCVCPAFGTIFLDLILILRFSAPRRS
jgi:hypothetical protein